MRKRLLSLLLALCLLVTAAPSALAAAVMEDVPGFYAKQQRGNTCTLASAAMMVRRRAYLDGLEDWSSLTESRLRRVAWSYVGLSHQFTICGITVGYGDFDRSTSVTAQIQDMLKEHPEGIVVYNRSKPHAILVTDYTNGVFYCSDPSSAAPTGRYPVAQATIDISKAHSYWYVSADINRPQGVGVSLAAADIVYPTRLAPGTAFALSGELTSPGSISQVRVTLQTDTGTPVQTAMAEPNDSSFSLGQLADQLDFAALTTGSYAIVLTADDEYGGRITLNKSLMIAGGETQTASYSGSAPVLRDINAVELTESGFDVECTAIAPVDGSVSVLYSVWAGDVQYAPGLVAEHEGDSFTAHVSANATLLGRDDLLVNITAMDADGNTARSALLVQISPDDNQVDQKLL